VDQSFAETFFSKNEKKKVNGGKLMTLEKLFFA
jgi:hypothetical protein